MGNEWTDYVQQLVDFAHAFPRFSVMNNKCRPCIPEFLPNIFRVLEGLAGYPTVMGLCLRAGFEWRGMPSGLYKVPASFHEAIGPVIRKIVNRE